MKYGRYAAAAARRNIFNTINSWHLHFFFSCVKLLCAWSPNKRANSTIGPFHCSILSHRARRTRTQPIHVCWCMEQDFFFFTTRDTGESISQPASKQIENKINDSLLRSFNCCLRCRGWAFTRISFYFIYFFFFSSEILTLGDSFLFLSRWVCVFHTRYASRRQENCASMHMCAQRKEKKERENKQTTNISDHFHFIVDTFFEKIETTTLTHTHPARSLICIKSLGSCNKWMELFHLQHFPVLFLTRCPPVTPLTHWP